MTIQELKKFATNSIDKHPLYQEEITDLFQLCIDNIEDGESEQNEINLCYNEILELIKE